MVFKTAILFCSMVTAATAAAGDIAVWAVDDLAPGTRSSFTDRVGGLTADVLSRQTTSMAVTKDVCLGAIVLANALSDSDAGNAMLKVSDHDRLTGHQDGAGGFNSLTIDITFKPSIIKLSQLVRKTEGNTHNGYQVYMTDEGKIGFTVGDGSASGGVVSRNTVTVGQWHRVIVTWENRFLNYNTQVMLDGIVSRSSTTVGTLANTTSPLTFGGLYRDVNNYGQFFAGEIKSVVIATGKPQMLDVHGTCDPQAFIVPTGDPLKNQPGFVRSEFIYTAPQHPECHSSTLVDLGGGQLAAAWNGGTCEGHIDFGVWYSRFDGSAWSSPVKLASGPGLFPSRDTLINPVLFKHSSGKVMLFFKEGTLGISTVGKLMTSDDNGLTWTKARQLPTGISGSSKNKPIELTNGSILCPVEGKMLITANFGVTWTSVTVSNPSGYEGVIQPTVLRHSAATLQALYRTQESKIAQSWSYNDGTSWSSVTLTTMPNNNSGIDAVTLADGRHLLVYNHSTIPDGQWGGPRTPLNVAVSSDGVNWQAALVLEDEEGEYSYPAVIQTQDGRVHITYTWQRLRVKHVVLDPSLLTLTPIVNGQWPQ